MLIHLLWTFFKIGLISFGGGYAMIPIIEHETLLNHWMSREAFTNAVAIAGMSPGPIATNSAVIVGYEAAGLPGTLAAALGIVLPSLILIIFAAVFFSKVHKHKLVKSAFYGLRPVVMGLIIYAAVHFGWNYFAKSGFSAHSLAAWVILLAGMFAFIRLRAHPLFVILFSGLAGAAFFS